MSKATQVAFSSREPSASPLEFPILLSGVRTNPVLPAREQFAHRLLLEVAPPEVQPQEGSVAKVCERTFTRD